MKIIYKICCPEHGEFPIEIEENPHMEFRNAITSLSDNNYIPKRFTAKCPKCGKRILCNTN